MKPFTYAAAGFGSILAMLWRMVMRLLKKIAGIRGVELEAPRGAHHAEPTSFTGESGAASQACAEACETLRTNGEFASVLAQSPNYRADLKGEGSVAYLKMALQRLGEDMKAAQATLSEQRAQLAGALEPIALRMNVTPQELQALLTRPQLGDAALSLDAQLPAARERALQVASAREQLERLKELFVDHCVCAVDPDLGDSDGAIGDVVRAALERIGDPELSQAVEQGVAAAALAGQEGASVQDGKPVAAAEVLRKVQGDAAMAEIGDLPVNLDCKQNPSELNSQNGFIEENASSVKSPPPPRRFALIDVGAQAVDAPAAREREG